MNRLDEVRSTAAGLDQPMVDLPLQPGPGADFSLPLAGPRVPEPDPARHELETAGLAPRIWALAADAAMVALVWAAAVLAAASARGELPTTAGLPWAAGFFLLLSFFTTVPALILFGKTPGMAVAGLAICPAEGRPRGLGAGEAIARWLGTAAAVATLGVALLFTLGSRRAPTPSDRFSGRSLERTIRG